MTIFLFVFRSCCLSSCSMRLKSRAGLPSLTETDHKIAQRVRSQTSIAANCYYDSVHFCMVFLRKDSERIFVSELSFCFVAPLELPESWQSLALARTVMNRLEEQPSHGRSAPLLRSIFFPSKRTKFSRSW